MTKTKVLEQKNERVAASFYNVNKIKIDKDNFGQIFYTLGDKQSDRNARFKGKEQVTTFFEQDFKRLNKFIGYIIPQFEETDSDDITVRSISIKYDGLGAALGCVISASVKFREDIKSPLNFSTPYVKFEDNDFELGRESKKIIDNLIDHAKKYMEGETRTKQLKLVDDKK